MNEYMLTPFEPVEVPATDTAMLERIGRLRVEVWRQESPLDLSRFPGGVWLDEWDAAARHWIVFDEAGTLVAAARLTVHDSLSASIDGHVWLRNGRDLSGRVANLSKLVVLRRVRGHGIGRALHVARIAAARLAPAEWIIGVASPPNRSLLTAQGFENVDMEHDADLRPGVRFQCVQLRLQ